MSLDGIISLMGIMPPSSPSATGSFGKLSLPSSVAKLPTPKATASSEKIALIPTN